MSDARSPSAPFLSLDEIAELVGGRVEGDGSLAIRGIAPLDQAGEEELAFLAQRRYLRFLPLARARAVLVGEDLAQKAGSFPGRVVVENPHQALPPLLDRLYPTESATPEIHPTAVLGKGVELGEGVALGAYAVVEEGARVGDGCRIGAHAVVGRGCILGRDTVLHPHVVLYPGTRLGERVLVHAGVCLGVDGFGFVPTPEGNRKVPQVGQCVVEDDVEIGANATIDRGSIGRTVLGEGTKLDNLVHMGHNVQTGKHVLMAAMAGVAGSTRIGDRVMMGGQVGLGGHIEIGEAARIGAQAGVLGDVAPGETVSGYPARNHRDYLRAMANLFKLPDAMKRVQEVEERLASLESASEE